MSAELRPFEDIEPGETARSGPYEVTREAILAFAAEYDPQPFHLDDAAATASLLGGLSASGWHTAAIGMRLYYDAFVRHVASMGAPGVDEVRWLRPVRPGDRLHLVMTIEGKRVSASRPDRGFVAVAFELRDAHEEGVMTQRFSMMVRRRGATETPHAGATAEPAPEAPSRPSASLDLMGFLDDAVLGRDIALGSHLFTPDAIVAFAQAFDPQPFHLDAVRARNSHFGGLVASGWQTAACWMKVYVAARARSAEARHAAGLPVASPGPSPGFVALKWLQPVRASQTIHYSLTVVGKRSLKRPGWGLIMTENTGATRDGTPVFAFEGRILWPMAEGFAA